MNNPKCPRCNHPKTIKSGIINSKQRYKCKSCNYYFSVNKLGKQVSDYTVIKALQLYIEGVSYREIERLLGISHVSVMNWVKKYQIKAPKNNAYRPTYKVLTHNELMNLIQDKNFLHGSGMILNELGDKFMMIKWERFKD